MTVMQWINFFDQILSITTNDSNEIFSFLEGKAREATIVPFSVFSNLFHQSFTRHRFLESTLEILQQFYIAIEKCDKHYHLFPGDQYRYSVKCMRCHKCVLSTTLGINETLLNAPSAFYVTEYPLDTWCWLGSSFNIPSSFVHINWILQSFKNIFWKFVRHNRWCSSLSIILQQQTLWQI